MFRATLVLATVLAFAQGSVVKTRPKPLDSRIVGGKNTTIEDHPYQLSLEVSGGHLCGASLIKPNIALTAAHCTNGQLPVDFKIRAGSTFRELGGETANVVSVCQHPKFTESTVDCDIAVLVLDRDLPLGPSVQTIELQPKNQDVSVGTLGTATGWGALYENGPSPPNLQEVELPRVSEEVCAETYSDLTENMICFGYAEGERDTCQRDSGGPMVVDGKQVGVVSFGYGCALPNTPGVYAKISSEDISDHIEQCIANS